MKKIFTKLFLSYLVIGLASAMGISVIFYFIMRDALIERAFDQLSSINILKREQIQNYLEESLSDFEFALTRESFKSFKAGGPISEMAQAEIEAIRRKRDFRTIAILDTTFNERFTTGPANVNYRDVLADGGAVSFNPFVEHSCIVDASPSSRDSTTTLLYVVPIGRENRTVAYVVAEENFNKIQYVLNENTGMGQTGETYIVGGDRRLRSTSRFFPYRRPTDIVAYDFYSDSAHVRPDYRNVQVISVDRPIEVAAITEMDWALVSEIDLSEAMGPINELRDFLIVTALALLLATMAVTAVVSNAITKPILLLRDVIIDLSKGIIPAKNISMDRGDEIGEIASAVNLLIEGLRRTTQFAYAIGEGKFETPFTQLSDKDTLGQALIHMRDELKSLREKEIRLVREKAGAVLEGQENERKRITRELHDGVGQLLTVIRLRLINIDGNEAIVEEIKSLLTETVDEVKRISFNVMPNTLVDFGLEAALNTLCGQVRKAGHIVLDFQYIREVDQPLSFDISTAVYRIAQEGLNNVLKHAEATRVNLYVIDKEDEIFMLLDDNGKGFSPEVRQNAPTGFGLRSMQERAKLLNGSVEVHSEWGAGTTIEAHIPIVHEFAFKL